MPTVSAGSLKAASPSLMLRRNERGELDYGFYAGHCAATSPGLYDGSGRRRVRDVADDEMVFRFRVRLSGPPTEVTVPREDRTRSAGAQSRRSTFGDLATRLRRSATTQTRLVQWS
jgi:hypothetical protein